MKKELFLTDDDFYRTWDGLALKGGNKMLYDASLVVKLEKDGNHTVLKDRYGLSKRELAERVNEHIYNVNAAHLDRRLLLM